MEQFTKPTDSTPFKLDENCIFYSEHFIIDNCRIDYSDIAVIIWKNSNKKMNGFNINSESEYLLISNKDKDKYIPDFTNANWSKGVSANDFSFKEGLIKNHRDFVKRQKFIHNFLYEISRPFRIEKTLNSIVELGYLTQNAELKIFDNGDFVFLGNFEGNLLERFRKDKFINGQKYGGYSNSVSNPYEFGFVKGTKFFGILEDKFVFDNIINADVIEILCSNLFKNGRLSAF